MLSDADHKKISELRSGILNGNRAMLARAITLVESKKPEHRIVARQLIQNLIDKTGHSIRIGISGVPGVGKSTTIEAFGNFLTGLGFKVAVLAVDPSSTRTGGSILGDKTRMGTLAINKDAYIRPSPSAGTLGGVASKTRESMLLCEAAGFDIILVETVGTGQSETAVAKMCDLFLVLMLPGAGDDLQGIKKGILEIADIIAVNKADGDNIPKARQAASDYRSALHMMARDDGEPTAPVLTVSGLTGDGLETLWKEIEEFKHRRDANNKWQARRAEQQIDWMATLVQEGLLSLLQTDDLKALNADLQTKVKQGSLLAPLAAEALLSKLMTD